MRPSNWNEVAKGALPVFFYFFEKAAREAGPWVQAHKGGHVVEIALNFRARAGFLWYF